MFSKEYPNLDWWIENIGWIELGSDEYSDSWVRILNEGGTCWEDSDSKTLDESLKKADIFVKKNYR